MDLLAHTLDLDLRFHLHRKTGEVTRILDRGGNALQNILSTVLFNIGTPCSQILTCSAGCTCHGMHDSGLQQVTGYVVHLDNICSNAHGTRSMDATPWQQGSC